MPRTPKCALKMPQISDNPRPLEEVAQELRTIAPGLEYYAVTLTASELGSLSGQSNRTSPAGQTMSAERSTARRRLLGRTRFSPCGGISESPAL